MNKLVNHLYYPENVMSDPQEKNRNYFIDNLKFLLITLVVIGHFGLKLTYVKEIQYLLYFIYVFHMPCFIFVSGFLSKRMNAGGKLRAEKILSIFWIYLIFKIGNVLLAYMFGEKIKLSLFKDASAPWYLIALCIWYLSIPLLERIKTNYLIAGSFVIGLLAGHISSLGDVFSLSRVFVFFPFFILGFCLSDKKLEELLKKHLRLPAAILLAVVLGVFLILGKYFAPVAGILYGASPYSASLHKLAKYGMFIRGVWYLMACILSIAVMLLVPRCKLFLSKYGERTLQIYMSHIWVRNALVYAGFFAFVKAGPRYLVILTLVGCVLLTFLLANRFFKKLFDLLMATKIFTKLLK